MTKTTATVKIKDNAGKVVHEQSYDKLVFEGVSIDDKGKPVAGDPGEMLSAAIAHYQELAGEKGNGVVELLRDVTYAYDLGKRAKVRAQLEKVSEGPEKATEKLVKDFMAQRAALGKPISEEDARKRIALLND